MKTVFFDIDTQIDFMFPAGALYVPGAEKLIPTIAKLNERAPTLISTVDTHTEDDPEFKIYPPHCVAGTVGNQKVAATLSGNQILLPKNTLDAFKNTKLREILADLQADAYVVYGVVTELCVKFVADQLLESGKPVTLVTDAIQQLDRAASEAYLQDFARRGGKLTVSTAL